MLPQPVQMSKVKSKPAKAAAAEGAEQSRPADSRARDLEEDIFDVAHNTMLWSKVVDHYSSNTSSCAALRQEWDGGVGERGIVPTPESMDKEAKSETEREEARRAVDATMRHGSVHRRCRSRLRRPPGAHPSEWHGTSTRQR